MENSSWDISHLLYLGTKTDDDEQLVCHQPSTSSQNPDDLISSHITSYNLVSFDNSDDVERVPCSTIQQPCCSKLEYAHGDSVNQFGSRRNQGTRNKGRRNPKSGRTTLDHVMAERKRRHDLAEKFIALSAIIPGLKKMDKASVLSGAINCVKQLQERIIDLEDKANKKKSIIESANLSKKSSVAEPYACGHNNNSHSNDDDDDVLPGEVEARVLEREVLIRIQCKKQNGIMLNIASLLENTHLSITSSSVLPFGNSTLNITIITQMRDEYGMTVNDLVKKLRREISSGYVRLHARAGD